MTPGDLLTSLEGDRIELFVKDGLFKYRAPRGAFDSTLRALVRAYRQELFEHWLCPRCLRIDRVFYGFPPDIRCRRCPP